MTYYYIFNDDSRLLFGITKSSYTTPYDICFAKNSRDIASFLNKYYAVPKNENLDITTFRIFLRVLHLNITCTTRA